MDFVGCKVVLVCGGDLLAYMRDDKPGLPWAGMWDLPGGGREGLEGPQDCVLREVEEEFGLRLGPARLVRHWVWPSMTDPSRLSVFYAGRLTGDDVAAVRFGDEGQYWRMMPVAEFVAHPLGIPEMQRRVVVALRELGW